MMQREKTSSLGEIRAGIVERLLPHLAEIEQAIYARIQDAVPDHTADSDAEYQAGVRSAITAVVVYSLEAIKYGPEWPAEPVPVAAAAQARRAARVGVSLGTILRRYVAGHAEFGELVMGEAQRSGLSSDGPAIHHLRRTQEALLERLTAAIEDEYNDECKHVASPPAQRREEIVRRLLGGESVDSAMLAELDYELRAFWHIGVVATGEGTKAYFGRLRTDFGHRLLSVSLDGMLCAWLGGPGPLTTAALERFSVTAPDDLSLAVGEPGKGIDGWRLTHHQAHAALEVAVRKPTRFARYADNRLLAAALQNETLARSLMHRYIEPLRSQKDSKTLRQTLRVYLDLECNASSAGHALNVGRKAVKRRVQRVEKVIGCHFHDCLAEIEVALGLDELDCVGTTTDEPTMR